MTVGGAWERLRCPRKIVFALTFVTYGLFAGTTGTTVSSAGAQATDDLAAVDEIVRYADDRLTVSIQDKSLHALLLEIGRQTGARVRIEGVSDRTISDRFTRLPLHEALRRLLAEENFTLIYSQNPMGTTSDGARLAELQIYGGGETAITVRSASAGPQGAVGEGTTGADAPGSMMEQLSDLLARHADVALPPGGPLSEALGAESASVQEMVATAMHTEDTAVRAEAAKVLAGVFDGDPQAQALVSGRDAMGMDPGAVAALMRTSGGPHADEFLQHIAMNLRTPALRVRANQILAALRSRQ